MSRKSSRRSTSLKDVRKLYAAACAEEPEAGHSVSRNVCGYGFKESGVPRMGAFAAKAAAVAKEVNEAAVANAEAVLNAAMVAALAQSSKTKKPERTAALARIRLMDSNDMGKIIGPAPGGMMVAEMDDGLTMQLYPSEFVIVNEAEDRQLLSGKISRVLAGEGAAVTRTSGAAGGNPVYDLHLEALPGGRSVPAGQQLEFQMERFHAIMRENLAHRGLRFSLIHGVGDGILRNRIRRELDEVYALRCTYVPGHSGVTVVTIR